MYRPALRGWVLVLAAALFASVILAIARLWLAGIVLALARGWSLIDQALVAFQKEDAGLYKGIAGQCWIIRDERGGGAASIRFAQQAAARIEAVLGPDHATSLQTRYLCACEIGNYGGAAKASGMLTKLAERATVLFGPDHRLTLETRDAQPNTPATRATPPQR